MTYLNSLRCTMCGKEFDPSPLNYLCDKCAQDYRPGMPLKGILEAVFDYDGIKSGWMEYLSAFPNAGAQQQMEKLCELFCPLEKEYFPPLPVGYTPLIECANFAAETLYLKFDGVNPSGSFKDRASFLMVAEANRLGIREIVAASTGNAASSLAAICAAAGLQAVIFTPAAAPEAKLVQIRIHGAELHRVDGTYDDAFAAALDYAANHECLNRNTAYHPYTIEGKKTAGLELYIQMKGVPDYIFIPTGDGVILSGIHKAFTDLMQAEIIRKLPRLVAVQAESSDAISSYLENGYYRDAASPKTVADSISVKTPSAAHLAYRALKESSGFVRRVSDNEILAAQRLLAERSGIFCEPSSAATLAAYYQAKEQALLEEGARTVLMLTGHGLKDIRAVKFDA
ncbi:MAG: pyridoxal-phosphate dependent enzyme [Candidatus Cloacimonetes bacterium]|nr:pyridoxal-phosphate dependent enzyme [Candidatus Cloacimonadota bacterium]HOA28958.1 pyridoxal-phosphate dependent enzyme [Candidatus Cloacimonadota bacterium]